MGADENDSDYGSGGLNLNPGHFSQLSVCCRRCNPEHTADLVYYSCFDVSVPDHLPILPLSVSAIFDGLSHMLMLISSLRYIGHVTRLACRLPSF